MCGVVCVHVVHYVCLLRVFMYCANTMQHNTTQCNAMQCNINPPPISTRWPTPPPPFQLSTLAAATESFSGADLAALCTSAVLLAVQRQHPHLHEQLDCPASGVDLVLPDVQVCGVCVCVDGCGCVHMCVLFVWAGCAMVCEVHMCELLCTNGRGDYIRHGVKTIGSHVSRNTHTLILRCTHVIGRLRSQGPLNHHACETACPW